jgi:outer membrane protein assembly factor BamB
MKLMQTALLAAAAAALAAQASEWPHFLGPDSNGISPEKGINKDWTGKPPKQLWNVPLKDDGYAGPSVAGGKVFIIDHLGSDDIVRAYELASGKQLWEFKYADAEKPNYGFSRATPAFDDGKLYTLSRSGNLNCIDAEKGVKLWSHNLRQEFQGVTGRWDYAQSPLIDGEKLIVCPGGQNGIVALNKETGKELFSGGGPDPAGYSTPVIATINGKKQYVIFEGKALIGVDPEKGGSPLWRCAWTTQSDINVASPIVVDDSSVFVTSGYGVGCGLIKVSGNQAQTAQTVWTNKEIQAHFNSPVLINGQIYGIGDAFGLVCLNPATGKANWKQAGFEKGGLLAIDGVLLAMNGAQGDCVMLQASPDAYKELGRFKPLGGQSWTAPIVADLKLIVRNKNKLACFDLK